MNWITVSIIQHLRTNLQVMKTFFIDQVNLNWNIRMIKFNHPQKLGQNPYLQLPTVNKKESVQEVHPLSESRSFSIWINDDHHVPHRMCVLLAELQLLCCIFHEQVLAHPPELLFISHVEENGRMSSTTMSAWNLGPCKKKCCVADTGCSDWSARRKTKTQEWLNQIACCCSKVSCQKQTKITDSLF